MSKSSRIVCCCGRISLPFGALLSIGVTKITVSFALIISPKRVFSVISVSLNLPINSFNSLIFIFSFARYKGELWSTVKGAEELDTLQDGDHILISEGCTHHRQCGDIGTEKLPNWIKNYTNKNINFDFTSGGDFPENLEKYKLIIHCGACMLTEREMKSRISLSSEQQIPLSNYGIVIAKINGILERATKPLKTGL